MRKIFVLLFLGFITTTVWSQEETSIKGKVLNASNDVALINVHVVNLNTVKGTVSGTDGEFVIRATVNDTLYFSYLGFKSIRVRVTNDWLK